MPDFSFISDPARVFGGQNQALRQQQAMQQAVQNAILLKQQQQMFPEQLQQLQLANQLTQQSMPYQLQNLQTQSLLQQANAQKSITLANILRQAQGLPPIQLPQITAGGQGMENINQSMSPDVLESGFGASPASLSTENQSLLKNKQQAQQAQQPMTAQSAQMQQPQQIPNNTGSILQLGAIPGVPNSGITLEDIVAGQLGLNTYGPRMQYETGIAAKQNQAKENTLNQASLLSNSANELLQNLSGFNSAMDKATYTGPRLGSVASSGLSTWFTPGDLSAEQEADRYAQQMLPGQVNKIRQAMGSARFSNLDMNQAQKLNFSRTMTPEARKIATDWTKAVQSRLKELPAFYNYMYKNYPGVSEATVNSIWAAYQNQNPLMNAKGNKVLNVNNNKWREYVKPEAVQNFMTGKQYIPEGAKARLDKQNKESGFNFKKIVTMNEYKNFNNEQKAAYRHWLQTQGAQ